MRNHVVYCHKFSNSGVVFYYGSGVPARPYDFSSRSEDHLKIIRSDNVTVELIETGLSKSEGHAAERKLILDGFEDGLPLINYDPKLRAEHSKQLGSASGKKNAKNKVGIHDPEIKKIMNSQGGKVSGPKTKLLGVGVHAQTIEQLANLGRLSSAQRWKCCECGMITSPGNLGLHQKSSKHIGKERIA